MDTKELLLDTAIKLFIKNGYDKTSIDDITRELEITKGAYYYHFKNKDEIFLRAVEVVFGEMEEWITMKMRGAKTGKDLIDSFFNLENYFSYSAYYDNVDNHMYHLLLDMVKLYPDLKSRVSESLFSNLPAMEEVIKDSQGRNEIKRDLNPGALAMMIVYTIEGLLFISAITGEESSLVEKGHEMGKNLWFSIKA